MGRISVETVHHSVSEPSEIDVAVGDLQDLLDQGVPSFDRTIGYSDPLMYRQSSGNKRKHSKSLSLKAFLMVLDFLE